MSFARFQEIVQRLTDADTWDQAALNQVASELEELEVMVAQIQRPELTGLLEVASSLVALVPQLDPIEAEDCRRMVVRLIQIALRRLHALRNSRKKNPARTHSGSGREKKPAGRPGMALGDVLVQMGFVTTEDLDRALAISKMKGRMLGEVLVQMGKCEREDVARAVFLQKNLQPADAPPEDENESTTGDQDEDVGLEDMLLGEALLRRGWINPEELLDALRLHKQESIKIGEALMRCGYANIEQIQQALAWQTEMRAKLASKRDIPKAYQEPIAEPDLQVPLAGPLPGQEQSAPPSISFQDDA